MAQYGPNDVKVEIEASVGAGSLTDITQYVTTLAGLKVNGNLEDGTPFGVQPKVTAPVPVPSAVADAPWVVDIDSDQRLA